MVAHAITPELGLVRRAEERALASLRASRRGVVAWAIITSALALADPSSASLLVGGAVSLTGELVRVVAAGYGYNVGELTVRGPYRFVRHPYFLGSALLYLGFTVAARDPFVAGLGLLALVITYALDVQADENRLKARLGPAFSEYRARVPAFLPQLLPYSSPVESQALDSRGFSLGHAVFRGRHRELGPLVGLALSYAFLFLVLRYGVMKPYLRWAVPLASAVYGLGRVIYYRVVGVRHG